MNNVTASGLVTTLQVGKARPITDLDSGNFQLPDGEPFLIKNDAAEAVELEVKYAMDDDFIATTFQPGWNEDVVREVKTTQTSVRLLWGR